MKIKTQKYNEVNRAIILKGLQQWLSSVKDNEYFFTTCYKSRAVGVFVQYEIPTRDTDPYLINADQGIDAVYTFIAGWLNAILKKEVVFKIEEREKVGFSIYITSETVLNEDIEVSEDEIEEVTTEEIKQVEESEDETLEESEKRSLEEIAISTTTRSIARSMKDDLSIEDTSQGIRRSTYSTPKVQSQVRAVSVQDTELEVQEPQESQEGKKKVGRKAEYNWKLLPDLYKKNNGSMSKIAKVLGCSAPAVRRQVTKLKKEGKL